jgi:hypothetical protein
MKRNSSRLVTVLKRCLEKQKYCLCLPKVEDTTREVVQCYYRRTVTEPRGDLCKDGGLEPPLSGLLHPKGYEYSSLPNVAGSIPGVAAGGQGIYRPGLPGGSYCRLRVTYKYYLVLLLVPCPSKTSKQGSEGEPALSIRHVVGIFLPFEKEEYLRKKMEFFSIHAQRQ